MLGIKRKRESVNEEKIIVDAFIRDFKISDCKSDYVSYEAFYYWGLYNSLDNTMLLTVVKNHLGFGYGIDLKPVVLAESIKSGTFRNVKIINNSRREGFIGLKLLPQRPAKNDASTQTVDSTDNAVVVLAGQSDVLLDSPKCSRKAPIVPRMHEMLLPSQLCLKRRS
jgi:hypothetical protein